MGADEVIACPEYAIRDSAFCRGVKLCQCVSHRFRLAVGLNAVQSNSLSAPTVTRAKPLAIACPLQPLPSIDQHKVPTMKSVSWGLNKGSTEQLLSSY